MSPDGTRLFLHVMANRQISKDIKLTEKLEGGCNGAEECSENSCFTEAASCSNNWSIISGQASFMCLQAILITVNISAHNSDISNPKYYFHMVRLQYEQTNKCETEQ